MDVPSVIFYFTAEFNFSSSGRKVIECSFVECEDLNTFGRFSFNKFNKEVEVCKEIILSSLCVLFCLNSDYQSYTRGQIVLHFTRVMKTKALFLHLK